MKTTANQIAIKDFTVTLENGKAIVRKDGQWVEDRLPAEGNDDLDLFEEQLLRPKEYAMLKK